MSPTFITLHLSTTYLLVTSFIFVLFRDTAWKSVLWPTKSMLTINNPPALVLCYPIFLSTLEAINSQIKVETWTSLRCGRKVQSPHRQWPRSGSNPVLEGSREAIALPVASLCRFCHSFRSHQSLCPNQRVEFQRQGESN